MGRASTYTRSMRGRTNQRLRPYEVTFESLWSSGPSGPPAVSVSECGMCGGNGYIPVYDGDNACIDVIDPCSRCLGGITREQWDAGISRQEAGSSLRMLLSPCSIL